jgi:hypothetical protein
VKENNHLGSENLLGHLRSEIVKDENILKIRVRLLEEGIEVFRPLEAIPLDKD